MGIQNYSNNILWYRVTSYRLWTAACFGGTNNCFFFLMGEGGRRKGDLQRAGEDLVTAENARRRGWGGTCGWLVFGVGIAFFNFSRPLEVLCLILHFFFFFSMWGIVYPMWAFHFATQNDEISTSVQTCAEVFCVYK